MNGYQIITDSTTDLSPALAEELGIEIIPMEITLSGASYLQFPDERALSNRTFYERLASGETATTNQINATTFTETFERYLQAGTDVLYIGFSSGLSGTYNNSRLAAQELSEKYPGRRILVLDSLAASMGEGLLVYHAVQKQREGMGIDELASWVEANRNRLAHWFTVDDLNFLKRGGRVSGAAALFGTMLGIKPVLHVDNDGHLIPVEKVRGRKNALDALVNHMEKAVEHPETRRFYQPWKCPRGRRICGQASESALFCTKGLYQLYRACDRVPCRAGDGCPILPREEQRLGTSMERKRFNEPIPNYNGCMCGPSCKTGGGIGRSCDSHVF